MGRKMIAPDEETFIAEHQSGLRLYAQSAAVPLYVDVRFVAPTGKRRSFRLGWIIDEKRWAMRGDYYALPENVLAWAAPLVTRVYPNLATATGLASEEIQALKDMQVAKREKHAK